MTTTLEVLLVQLRDRTGDGSVLARARALASCDERIPPDVREVVLTDPADAADDAVALLALLGVEDSFVLPTPSGRVGMRLADAIQAELADDPGLSAAALSEVDDGWSEIADALREGIAAEAGSVEVASAVLRRLPLTDFAWGPVLADAVQGEAGALDVADVVLKRLDREQPPVAGAVLAEAGEVDVADAVLAALGLPVTSVREAVLAEAGSVDLADRVMERIGAADAIRAAQQRVAPAPVIPGPSLVESTSGSLPRPANNLRRFGLAAMALAAVALISVVVAQLVPTPEADSSLLFAQAGDVVIEDLSAGDDVSVTQLEGDDGAVILWIDEEA